MSNNPLPTGVNYDHDITISTYRRNRRAPKFATAASTDDEIREKSRLSQTLIDTKIQTGHVDDPQAIQEMHNAGQFFTRHETTLDDIYATAYSDGFNNGFDNGFDRGHRDGQTNGFNRGHVQATVDVVTLLRQWAVNALTINRLEEHLAEALQGHGAAVEVDGSSGNEMIQGVDTEGMENDTLHG